MVKRYGILLIILSLFASYYCLSSFGYDVINADSDSYCFQYDNSTITSFDSVLSGSDLFLDTSYFECEKFYIYVPISSVPESLSLNFSFISSVNQGMISTHSYDYGTLSGGAYNIIGSLSGPGRSFIGRTTIQHNSQSLTDLYIYSYNVNVPLPDDDTIVNNRYIRLGFTPTNTSTIRFYNYVDINMGHSVILYDDTDRTWSWDSGYIKQIGNTYLNGNYKSYGGYANSGNTQLEKIYTWLDNSTSGSGGYMRFSGLALQPESSSIPTGTISRVAGTGSAIHGYEEEPQRLFLDTVSVKATRTFSDEDMITAVNNASDRNHTDLVNFNDNVHTDITNFSNRNHSDLVNIGNDLQELVDHQDQVNQAGNDIGSTTSSSSISNTSGNLGSGVSGLNSALSTASDVSSFVTDSSSYISFIGAFLPVVLNFGDGVLAWAVVAIIAVTVFLYILKKVSE